MQVTFTIPGNHLDPERGNPIPYVRTTQRQKFKDERYLRYAGWKKYVQDIALVRATNKCTLHDLCANFRKQKIRLDCMIYFGSQNHGDPENVRKGIQDSLFKQDKYVMGSVDFDYDRECPRVEVMIRDETQGLDTG